jgi:hypothetical protein
MADKLHVSCSSKFPVGTERIVNQERAAEILAESKVSPNGFC